MNFSSDAYLLPPAHPSGLGKLSVFQVFPLNIIRGFFGLFFVWYGLPTLACLFPFDFQSHFPSVTGFWYFNILFLGHHFSAYMCCPVSSYSLWGSFLWLLNPVSQDLINKPIYHLLFYSLDQAPRIQSQACFPSSFQHMLAGSCISFLSLLVPICP